tara:strand:+ start:3186 stop:5048 length:1863 start_codon:yes stop_codon:yes gene_type:complete
MPSTIEIIDLSRHFSALERYQDISERLTDEEQAKIVSYMKQCHTMSHRSISKRYSHWDEADAAHDVYVDPDATDFREKAVIPDTRAIADTVITYQMSALGGRNPMFQLEGQNRNSRKPSLLLERVLHQQMRRTAGEARIAQHLLDIVRYGMAPTKVIWDADGNQNNIVNFEPRKTFPDPRVSWGDWDNMGFIIFSDHISFEAIHRSRLYPKINKNPEKYADNIAIRQGWQGHRDLKQQGKGYNVRSNQQDGTSYFHLGANRITDEGWLALAGYQVGLPTITTIYLQVTIMDEKEIISCRLNPYGRQFPSVIGGMYHDSHKTYSQSLYDILLPLHDIATWLMRSRVDNVQASLNNLIFADPTMVSIPDLIDRNEWGIVRTMPGVKPGDGIHIASVQDVTRGHWNDIAALSDMKQRVSAASDAQQGVPTADVRSATEISRLTQLGSQRLGVLSRIISATSIRPMVRMMVGNIQDSLAYNGSINATKGDVPPQIQSMINDGYIDFSIEDLQGDIDYLVIDGTLPIEPTRNAQTWIDMLTTLNQTGLIMEYKAGKIAEEAIRAMGVSDVDQFKISDEEAQEGPTPSQQMAMAEMQRGNSVQPAENVARQVERGNLIPQSQARTK